jgi:signal transduction histidine kinase
MRASRPQSSREYRAPIRLVRFIIGLGCLAGMVMAAIIWWSSVEIRRERERLDGLKERLVESRATVERQLLQKRWYLYKLLDAGGLPEAVGNGGEESDIVALVGQYRKLADPDDRAGGFVTLQEAVGALSLLQEGCRQWAGRQAENRLRLPEARKKAETALSKVEEAVEQRYGRQRLELAIDWRRFQDRGAKGAEELAQKIIREEIASGDLSVLRRDIADLSLLVEQLRGEEEEDLLVDLKDNRLRTVLARLRSSAPRQPRADRASPASVALLLDRFEAALFGKGYRIENEHQTVVPGVGGLYGLSVGHLRLAREKEALALQLVSHYDAIREALFVVGARVEQVIAGEAAMAEKTLRRAWRIMLFVSLVTAAGFLLASARIIKAIRGQISQIEEINRVLDGQTRELLQSREELSASQERLQLLSGSLLTAQEDERRRIARELHDELGQAMTALKLQVRSAEKSMGDRCPPEAKGKCEALRQSIQQIIENVRRLSRDLSPAVLEDLGLAAAIEYLLENFSQLHGVAVTKELAAIEYLASQDTQRNVYRIVQELLTNIGKHAQATEVSVTVRRQGGELLFSIADDGRGFNVEQVRASKDKNKGMGLNTVAERVRLLGGTLTMESAAGKGTRIQFTAPL